MMQILNYFTSYHLHNSIRKVLRLVAIGLLLSTSASNASQEYTLTASLKTLPSLCITERSDKSCILEVELTWSSTEINNFCIYSSTTEKPLACWQKANKGKKTISVYTQSDIYYRLVLKPTKETVAKAALTVQTAAANPRYPRRRRHAWSLF